MRNPAGTSAIMTAASHVFNQSLHNFAGSVLIRPRPLPIPWLSLRLLLSGERFRFQAITLGICGEQCWTGTGFCPNISVSPCQYHTTILSQYFSFPLSVSYHHCSMLSHLSVTEVTWSNHLKESESSYETFHQISSNSALRADSY